MKRDGPVCRICGVRLTEKEATIDHIIPKSKGGKNSTRNLQLACHDCNQNKGNSLPGEYEARYRQG